MTAAKKSTAEHITDVVKAYYAVPPDTADITRLIGIRAKLAVLLFGYAIEVGDLYTERAGAEYRRKSAQGKVMAKAFADNKSAAAAGELARIETDEQIKDEVMSDAFYRSAYLILSQGNEVLAAIQQHIAHARREHHAETTNQGSQTV